MEKIGCKKKKIARWAAFSLALCLLMAGTVWLLWSRSHRVQLQEELQAYAGSYEGGRIIVQDTSEEELSHLAQQMGAQYRLDELGKMGVLYLPDGTDIEMLCKDPRFLGSVGRWIPDYYVEPSALAEGMYASATAATLNSSRAGAEATGEGITIAVIDTGLDLTGGHFEGRISENSYNASTGRRVADYGYDVINVAGRTTAWAHGTYVAGLIAAAPTETSGYCGMAPEAELVIIRCDLNDQGNFLSSDLVMGLAHAIACNVDIINMSFGGFGGTNPFAVYTKLAVDSDIICVTAAGNDGTSALAWPAADENVISVGFVGNTFGISGVVGSPMPQEEELSPFSNYGDNLDLVAPGYYQLVPTPGILFPVATGGGSTFSCAAVTGALALYLEKSEKYQEFSHVKEVLLASCRDLGEPGNDWYYGAGMLDVDALVLEEKGTITFDYLTDEIPNSTQVFVRGHILQSIPEPEREYSVFDGWYYDPACTDEFDNLTDALVENITVYASWVNEDDTLPYTYIVKADGTAEITGYTGKRRYLSIPSVIEGYTVTSIGEAAFMGNSRLRTVSLPETLTHIDERAFCHATSLQGIVLPKSLVEIGNYAFSECSKLATVGIPADGRLKAVGQNAFAYCGRLSRFDIPEKLETLWGSTFLSDTSMTTITVAAGNNVFWTANGSLYQLWVNPYAGNRDYILVYHPSGLGGSLQVEAGTTNIGAYALAYSNIQSVDLPDTLGSIGNGAFQNSKLTEIVIPDSVVALSRDCFSGIHTLKSVTLGVGITTIPESAFAGCYMLDQVAVSEGSALTSIDHRAFMGCSSLTEFLPLETTVTAIGDSAFAGTGISQLRLGAQVETMQHGAFAGSAVSQVAFDEDIKLRALETSVFFGCKSLTEISIPKCVTKIDASCFQETGLETVWIHADMEVISSSAFLACWDLTSIEVDEANELFYDQDGVLFQKDPSMGIVLHTYPTGKQDSAYTIGDDVNHIADRAFFACIHLNNVTFGQNVVSIGSEAFASCAYLREVVLNPAMREVGMRAFQGCDSASKVVLNEGLETISPYAFSNMDVLPEITIPSTVISIGWGAFQNDWTLTEVTFAENSQISTLDQGAFRECAIHSITIPASVSFISLEVFDECINLEEVIFADNSKLESISAWTFRGADSLERVVFGENNSLVTIGARAFEYLPKLSSINLQDCHNLEVIHNYSFQFCPSLKNIQLPENLLNIGRYAFYACSSLDQLVIPGSVEHIGRYAFAKCADINLYFTSAALPVYLDENWDFGIRGYCCGTVNILDSEDGLWKYALLQDGTVSIESYLGNGQTLDISQIDGYPVSAVGAAAFKGNETLQTVTLPAGLKSIFNNAFEGTTALTGITIPAGVTHIGAYAFYGSGISSVHFEEGTQLQLIEKYAFAETKGLTSVVLPASVREIRDYAFSKSGLTGITFPAESALTAIGRNAFEETGLTEVVLPFGLERIGYYAFANTPKLRSVAFGETTPLMLYGYAFYNSGLQQLTVPGNVEYIGEHCFAFCRNLSSMQVSEENAFYSSDGGILMDKEGRKIITVPAGMTGSYEIPARVSVLGFGAFEGSQLSEITIPEDSQLVTIGYRAFYNVSSLQSIYLPASLVSIDFYGFAYCENLKTVTFAEGCHLGGIYEGAFYGCSSLTEIVLSDELKEIGKMAFYGCEQLTSVVVSENSQLEIIGDSAFEHTGLTEVNLPETVMEIGSRAYAYSDMTMFAAPASVEYIGSGILEGVTSLESMTVPYLGATKLDAYEEKREARLSYFFDSSFDEWLQGHSVCSTLTTVHISDLRHINTEAFAECNSIQTITCDEQPQSIGEQAFRNCTSLIAFECTQKLETMEERAFLNCSALTRFGDADLLQAIPAGCFESCSSLETVGSLGSVRSLGIQAFYGCGALEKLSLPETVTEIPRLAFHGCCSLKEMDFLQNIVTIGGNAFGGCSFPSGLNLPNVEKIGEYAFDFADLGGTLSIPKVVYLENRAFANSSGMPDDLTLPDTLEYLGAGAFANCQFKRINIPEGITHLEDDVFWRCKNLVAVALPDSLKSIGNAVFAGCTSLESLSIPAGVTTIGYGAFSETGMPYILCPEGLQSVGNRAFSSCQAVFIPATVTQIGKEAFAGTRVYLAAAAPGDAWTSGWDDDAGLIVFGSTPRLLEDGTLYADCAEETRLVRYAGAEAEVTLDTSGGKPVTAVDPGAFADHAGITKVTLAPSVQYLGIGAFRNCASLKQVVFPESYAGPIPENAFRDCVSLEEITLSDGIPEIGAYAFYHCSALPSVKLPDTITQIHPFTFGQCTALTSMQLPESITKIEEHAFGGCTAWTDSLALPNVTEIGAYAFMNCSRLAAIDLTDNYVLTTFREGALHRTCLEKIYVPESVTTIERYALDGPETICIEGATLPENMGPYWTSGNILYNYPRKLITDAQTGLVYGLTPDKTGAVVYDWEGETTDLVLDTLGGVPVVEVLDGLFERNTEITSVHLGSGLRMLPEEAFQYCTGLTSVTVADNCPLEVIPNRGFYGCAALTTFDFGKLTRLSEIGNSAFMDTSLQSVTLPDSVTSIGHQAFLETPITELVIPDSVTSCGSQAFYRCAQLKSVILGNGLKDIPEQMFAFCSNLCSVTFPEEISTIGEYAFYPYCPAFEPEDIPKGITSMYATSFPNHVYSEVDGLLYFGACLTGVTSELTEVLIVPEGTTLIAGGVFTNRSDLHTVVLPESLRYLNSSAFSYSSVSQVRFQGELKQMGSYCFAHCYNLATVELPAGLEAIPDYAFYESTGLEEITIPEGVTAIGEGAFQFCSNLKKITLPDGLETLGDYALWETNLTELEIPDTVTKIGRNILYGVTQLQKLVTPFVGMTPNDGLTLDFMFDGEVPASLREMVITGDLLEIPKSICNGGINLESIVFLGTCSGPVREYAFAGLPKLTKLVLPQGITRIEPHMLYETDALSTLELPDSITEMDRLALAHSKLEQVVLPAGLTVLSDGLFSGCTELKSVQLPENLQTIEGSAFSGCTALQEIIIPEGVTSIERYAFHNCSSLKRIVFPDSLETLGDCVLIGCTNLESISIHLSDKLFVALGGNDQFHRVAWLFGGYSAVWERSIPESLKTVILRGTQVPDYAMNGMDTVEQIILMPGIETIGKSAFEGCAKLKGLTVPEGVTAIRENAFNGCEKIEYIVFPESLRTLEHMGTCSVRYLEIPSGVTEFGGGWLNSLEVMYLHCPLSVANHHANGGSPVLQELIISNPDQALNLSTVKTIILDQHVDDMAAGFLDSVTGAVVYCCEEEGATGWPEKWMSNNVVHYGDTWRYSIFRVDGHIVKTSFNNLGGVIQLPAGSLYTKQADAENSYTFLGWDCDGNGAVNDLLVTAPMGVVVADAVYSVTPVEKFSHIRNPDVQQNAQQLLLDALTDSDASKLVVDIAAETVEAMEGTLVVVDTDLARLTFDQASSGAISSVGTSVCLTVETVDTDLLDSASEGDQLYDLRLTANGVNVPFDQGSVEISVPCYMVPAQGEVLRVFHVAENGIETEVEAVYDEAAGMITFKTNHFSVYRVAASQVAPGTKKVISIEMENLPNVLSYMPRAEALDLTGGSIRVRYNDHSTEIVPLTARMVSGFDSSLPGEKTVTVTYEGRYTEFTVTVAYVPVTEIVLQTPQLYFDQLGSTAVLSASALPENASNLGLIFTSQNPEIVQVDEKGLVTAISYGETEILVTSAEDDAISVVCSVTVHQHSMPLEKVDAVAASCTRAGNIAYWRCDCGKLFGDELAENEIRDAAAVILPATGHSFGQWYTVKAADDTFPGLSQRDCANCGSSETGAFTTTAAGTCGAKLEWVLTGTGKLWISGTGAMDTWNSGEDIPWSGYAADVVSLQINAGVTQISDFAFSNLSGLTAVTIPKGVTWIGSEAFAHCSGLLEITFLGAAPEIGTDAFRDVAATVYYSGGDASWTEERKQSYGGTLAWAACVFYDILEEGTNTVVQMGKEFSIRIDADHTTLTAVCVNEELVDPANYTVTQGSTVVTFTAEYLATLQAGIHDVVIHFEGGRAFCTIEVPYAAPAGMKGDLNLDGIVNSDDLTLLARHVGGIEIVEGQALANADVNGDGQVNSDDLTKHARFVGGIITDWAQS